MSSAYLDFKALLMQEPRSADYTIQALWNASTADNSQRYIIIQQNGNASDEDIRNMTFDVVLISRVNDTDYMDLWDDAESINKYLLENYKSNCQFGLNGVNDVSSPRIMSDGRAFVRMVYAALYSTN